MNVLPGDDNRNSQGSQNKRTQKDPNSNSNSPREILLGLKNMNITSGNQLMQSGYYKMIIENTGKIGGKDTISVGMLY